MGWVLMSEREARRVEIKSDVVPGNISTAAMTAVLYWSEQQVHSY